jgi:hypothetical protein
MNKSHFLIFFFKFFPLQKENFTPARDKALLEATFKTKNSLFIFHFVL